MNAMSDAGLDAFSLAGRRAVVTGAARGLGAAIAARFVDCGAEVIVVDRIDVTPAEGVADVLVMDLGDPGAPASVFAETRRRFGDVDILVNNAGVITSAPLASVDPQTIDDTARVNYVAPLLLCREFAAQVGRRKGSIINIASSGGIRVTSPGQLVYGSLKAALSSATQYLAQELGPDIRVNAIAPGSIATGHPIESAEQQAKVDAIRAQIVARCPLGRLGQPDEIATVATFLASSAASYITGQTLLVDGGWLLT